MGFLTHVTIYNDALDAFESDPEQFAKAIFEGIARANQTNKATDMPFSRKGGGGYSGYLCVEPSRHADDHTVFVHSGNMVFNLNPWNNDFRDLLVRNPEYAASLVKTAQAVVDSAKDALKKAKKEKKAEKKS